MDASYTNDYMDKVASLWAQWAYMVFDEVEDVWHLKWPPVTHLASNWQLTTLACEVSHNNQF